MAVRTFKVGPLRFMQLFDWARCTRRLSISRDGIAVRLGQHVFLLYRPINSTNAGRTQ
jgi:hypothetical protein